MTLNTKSSNLLATASTLLGLWVYTYPAIANTPGKDREPISMSQWRNARLCDGDLSTPNLNIKEKPTPASKRPVRVDWNKVIPYINAYIHRRPSENTKECLSRSFEDAKFFLESFEKDYGVTVVWEDKNNIYPDMTEKLRSYVVLTQAIRQMTGADTKAFEKTMQQVTKKIADERSASL